MGLPRLVVIVTLANSGPSETREWGVGEIHMHQYCTVYLPMQVDSNSWWTVKHVAKVSTSGTRARLSCASCSKEAKGRENSYYTGWYIRRGGEGPVGKIETGYSLHMVQTSEVTISWSYPRLHQSYLGKASSGVDAG
jgi:hypothetical protein